MMTFAQQFKEEYKKEFMSTLVPQIEQKSRQEGRQEGRLEGRQEGEQNKALVIAKRMLNMDKDWNDIKEITGLSDQELLCLENART
jgi:recombination-promoting nuclease RpnB